jgi:enoyl-CoA hydratase
MTVRIEKEGRVWTVIHSRPEAKNAMDPASAAALEKAFLAFERDDEASVAVLWGEGGAFRLRQGAQRGLRGYLSAARAVAP